MPGAGFAAVEEVSSSWRQYAALLDVSRSIASCTDLQELFDQLNRHLHRVLSSDYVILVLHDAARNVMRLRTLSSDIPEAALQTGCSLDNAAM